MPGELLVRFERTATAGGRADVLADLDATAVQRLPLSGLVRVRLEPGMSVAAAQAAFERRDGVRYAQPNHRYRIAATPNDEYFATLWGMTKIEAPGAWDTRTDSSAVTVAVVDTGIEYTHPDLQQNVWENDDPVNGVDDDGNGQVDDHRGWDFVNNDNDPFDDHIWGGHGTHVSGTIGARGNNLEGVTGVNWQVKLMPLKAADDEGSLADSWIVQAFQYACANGARIVNGSFGGPRSRRPCSTRSTLARTRSSCLPPATASGARTPSATTTTSNRCTPAATRLPTSSAWRRPTWTTPSSGSRTSG